MKEDIKAAIKIQKIIQSCATKEQLDMCNKIVERYDKMFYPYLDSYAFYYLDKHEGLTQHVKTVTSLFTQINQHQLNKEEE